MARTRPALVLAALLALASSALAQDPFTGSYELTGKFSNAKVGEWRAMGDAERETKAEVSIAAPDSSGVVTVTRTGRYTGTRWIGDTRSRDTPPFTWVGQGRVVGDELKVTYRLAQTPGGLTGGLGGAPAGGGAYVFEATYRIHGSRKSDSGRILRFWPTSKTILLETIANTTVSGDHAFWRSLWSRGPRRSRTP